MKNVYIYGIAYGCPKKDREKDCPLLKVEHLSFKEKTSWINELEDDKAEAILRHHTNCTKKKVIMPHHE